MPVNTRRFRSEHSKSTDAWSKSSPLAWPTKLRRPFETLTGGAAFQPRGYEQNPGTWSGGRKGSAFTRSSALCGNWIFGDGM